MQDDVGDQPDAHDPVLINGIMAALRQHPGVDRATERELYWLARSLRDYAPDAWERLLAPADDIRGAADELKSLNKAATKLINKLRVISPQARRSLERVGFLMPDDLEVVQVIEFLSLITKAPRAGKGKNASERARALALEAAEVVRQLTGEMPKLENKYEDRAADAVEARGGAFVELLGTLFDILDVRDPEHSERSNSASAAADYAITTLKERLRANRGE